MKDLQNPVCNLNVLSLSGGGIRGYISVLFLQKFCAMYRIPERQFINLFDIVGGTSIGGILTIALTNGVTPSQLVTLFETKRKDIFPSRPNWFQKLKFLATGESFYDQEGLMSAIQQVIPDIKTKTINQIKKRVVITTLRRKTDSNGKLCSTPIYITNVQSIDPKGGNGLFTLYDACRATSSAPMYFPPYKKGKSQYIDGGVWCNNPAMICLNALKSTFRTSKRQCVLSVGTGATNFQMHKEQILQESLHNQSVEFFNGAQELIYTISAAITSPESDIDFNLHQMQQHEIYNRLFYYKFQPLLDDYDDVELDNTSDDFFKYMRRKVDTVLSDQMVQNQLNNFYNRLFLQINE